MAGSLPIFAVRRLFAAALLAVGLVAGAVGGAVCARHPGSWRARILQLAALLALCTPVTRCSSRGWSPACRLRRCACG